MNPSASAAAAGGIERLGLGTEVRELKFGSSFKKGSRGSSFHSIRYDFKPASVDTTKPAVLEVESNNQVTISVPNSDGNGTSVFKGPRKPYTKECVLIIDNETGEVTLEKLTHNIQVKKTRQEKPERPSAPNVKPTQAPVPTVDSDPKKGKSTHSVQSSSHSSSSKMESSSSSSKHSSRKNDKERKSEPSKSSLLAPPPAHPSLNHLKNRPQSPLISVPAKHSPLGPSPGHVSPSGNGNYSGNPSPLSYESSSRHYNNNHQQHPALPSLSSMEEDSSSPRLDSVAPKSSQIRPSASPRSSLTYGEKPGHGKETISANPIPEPKKSGGETGGRLSEDSSSESSSSSSSDGSDDSSSDEDMEEVVDAMPVPGAVFRQPQEIPSPKKNASSFLHQPHSKSSNHQHFQHSSSNQQYAQQQHRSPVSNRGSSMPSHLLSEDLQLSETGSDSD